MRAAHGFRASLRTEDPQHYLDRPGRVRVRVGESVRVGGDGVVALDGTLSVPADDEDGILEA